MLFIPNLLSCLTVALTVIAIELGVAGFMSLWDVYLDTISMICLIMCIGFSVDFSVHISYAYLTAEAASPRGKLEEALERHSLPILQCATSTILAVSALIFSPSYIFMTFFKIVFLVMVLGVLHCLFLLPVLLSTFVKKTQNDRDKSNYFDERNNIDMDKVEEMKNLNKSNAEVT